MKQPKKFDEFGQIVVKYDLFELKREIQLARHHLKEALTWIGEG